jgi:hypothetical protein
MGELLLKATDPGLVRKEVERKFPDPMLVKAAIGFLHRIAGSELLLTHITAVPALYDGDCQKCRQFLHESGIKVAAVSPIKQCIDCQQRNNIARSCSLIGARIMEDGVTEAEVNQAIDELRAKDKLSPDQVRALKANGDVRKRLIEAVQLSYGAKGKRKPEESVSKSDSEKGLTLATESFASKDDAVLWAVGAHSQATTASQVKQALRKKQVDAEDVVNEALVATKIVHADPLAQFMGDKYPSQGLGDQNNGETKEAKEIQEFFADSDLIAEVDPDKSRKTIDVKFRNEGAEMTINLGPSGAISNT